MALTEIDDQDDPLLAEAAQLRALPAFPAAIREYTVGLAHFREVPRLVNKLYSSELRFRLTAYLLYLDAEHEEFGTSGGATYARLLDLCTRRNEISPRVLKTTLAILKLTGFIRSSPSPSDRRSKRYQPTARMFEVVDRWIPHAVNALDALQPEMQRARMWKNDPGFLRRFLIAGGLEHTTGKLLIERMPDFNSFFGKREGAIALVLAVMLSDIDNTPLPSRAHIAKRFGLSKTQVTKLIAEGASIGFFAVDSKGVPIATSYLRDSYGKWISVELAFYAHNMLPANVR